MPDNLKHYRITFTEDGQERSITFWRSDLATAASHASAWLAVNRPTAILVRVEEIPTSPSDEWQAQLRRQGYSRKAAYEELHGRG